MALPPIYTRAYLCTDSRRLLLPIGLPEMISKVAARLLVLFHLTAVTLTASILPGSLSLTTSHTLNLTLPHNGTLWEYVNSSMYVGDIY